MIRIVEKDTYSLDTIPMNEMEPLQIGIDELNGDYVMRTASTKHFEVLNLSHPGKNKCWSDRLYRKIRLLSEDETLIIAINNALSNKPGNARTRKKE